MSKRTFYAAWLVAMVCIAMTMNAFGAKAPNFVVFYVDDLGWADTTVRMMKDMEGSRSYFHQTPALEKMAKRGMVFSNAYSPAPTCTPSRISVTFGKTNAKLRYTTVHDIAANNEGLKERIPKENVSLPQMFKQAKLSYVTAFFGKGIAIAHPKELGYDFDDQIDNSDNGNYHGEYVKNAPADQREQLPPNNPKRIYSLTKTAEDFIEKQGASNKPFFMFMSHYSVHVPHAASAHLIEKYRKLPRGKHCRDDDYMDPSEMSVGKRTCAWRLQYAAMIEETDMSLGRIVDALDKAGVADNTYLIFTSDNGGGMTPNGALTGGKANLHEGGLRVPTVVTGPGIPADTQCDVPIIQWDFLATFHDLCGSKTPLPEGVDGGSLRGVFTKGNKGSVDRPIPGLIFNYPYYAAAPVNAIRMGDYKLMRQLNTGEERLYNVVDDISEKNNLINSKADIAMELAKSMDKYLEEVDARKIDEVYKARLTELEEGKERSVGNEQRKMEKELSKAPAGQHAQIKSTYVAKFAAAGANYDRQIQHCKNQMQNKNFIGGYYPKPSNKVNVPKKPKKTK